MTTQKPISKAKQNKIDESNRLEQEQIISENLFISTYTEKLFKLAHDFRRDRWNAVTISQEGFHFPLETYRGKDVFIPHSPVGDLRGIKDRFETIQQEIDYVLDEMRLEEEKKQKIQAAKDKINQVLTEEERKLLGL